MVALLRRYLLPSLLLIATNSPAQEFVNVYWDPITDAERQMREPAVDKSAGVEALFWNIHVEDAFKGQDLSRILNHYVRLKIFDEKGKEKASTLDIEFGEHTSIINIAARTIKADGTIVEMKRDAVFQRDLVRAGGTKVKVKSFAVPGVEPGAIVEYRYREVRDDPRVMYARLQMQREYPVQKVTYFVKPLSNEYSQGYRMASWPFNCKPSPFKEEKNGFTSFTLENVPAFRDEPMMPGEPNVRPWVLLVYRQDGKREPEKYWGDIGRKQYDRLKQSLKVNDEMKRAVQEATSSAKTDEEKAAALVRYLRKQTRGFFDTGVTDAERTKVLSKMPKDRWRTSLEVLMSRLGTSDERNLLLAAMASVAGLEARPALLPSRTDVTFGPEMVDDYFLDSVDVAIKIGSGWKVYDVGANHLPPGMLAWNEEDVATLVSDPKKPTFIDSPVARPEESLSKRTARLKLAEDGTLEGDIDETYTGHSADGRRSKMEGESESRQQELAKESITSVFPQAEVSLIALKNVEDPEQPYTLHYHIKLPHYAARTAKRILIQPLFFQRGTTPLFTAAERRFDIMFQHAWKESDDITIDLPAGYVLDNPENGTPMAFGKPGSYALQMSLRDGKQLVISRELTFGNEGQLHFDKRIYPQLKMVFDEIYGRDTKAVSLRLSEGGL